MIEEMLGIGFLGGGEEVRGERQGRLFGLYFPVEEGRLTRSGGIGVVIVRLVEGE